MTAAATLRPAGPGDSELAFRVRHAAFREYVERAGGWDEHDERRRHAERFAARTRAAGSGAAACGC